MVIDRLIWRVLLVIGQMLRWIKVPEGVAAHDLKQPGPRHAGVAQLGPKAPGAGKAVLHHVFRNRTRARQRPGTAKQKTVVIAHPLVVARLGGRDHEAKERNAQCFIPSRAKIFADRRFAINIKAACV